MLPSGYIVLNRYRIDRLIGVGGMGLIFRAFDTQVEPEEAVAIKLLRPTNEQSEKDVKRFEREARLLSQLAHPHVLDVREVGQVPNGVPVLVMELLEGRDLRQEIRVRQKFPVEEAVGYVIQAAEASSAVHDAGIVHRDIKPQNLFITKLSGARHLKLLDFGISKQTEGNEATLTATQGTLGTPQYMSPEQIFGAKDVDQRSDIWALGVILYFLLAGRLPFTGPTPGAVIAMIPNSEPRPLREFRNDIPPELIETCERCLKKEPEERYDSARALVDALLPFGPPDGTIIAPVVDMPSTVPPIALKGAFGQLDVMASPAARWTDAADPERTPSLDSTVVGPVNPVQPGLDLLPVKPGSTSLEASVNVPNPEVTVPSSRRRTASQRGQRRHARKLAFVGGAAMAMAAAWWVGTRGASEGGPNTAVEEEAALPTEADEVVLEGPEPARNQSAPQPADGPGGREVSPSAVTTPRTDQPQATPNSKPPAEGLSPEAPPAKPSSAPRPAPATEKKPATAPALPTKAQAPSPEPPVSPKAKEPDAPPLYL